MRDGLEEFLKRIESRPSNETLIDRFVTLVLEENALERILYLKKLVGLLITPNPYTALKIAALELQEARKENLTKEYEVGALKDVESCFLKLNKLENVKLVREEINKLQSEMFRENSGLKVHPIPNSAQVVQSQNPTDNSEDSLRSTVFALEKIQNDAEISEVGSTLSNSLALGFKDEEALGVGELETHPFQSPQSDLLQEQADHLLESSVQMMRNHQETSTRTRRHREFYDENAEDEGGRSFVTDSSKFSEIIAREDGFHEIDDDYSPINSVIEPPSNKGSVEQTELLADLKFSADGFSTSSFSLKGSLAALHPTMPPLRNDPDEPTNEDNFGGHTNLEGWHSRMATSASQAEKSSPGDSQHKHEGEVVANPAWSAHTGQFTRLAENSALFKLAGSIEKDDLQNILKPSVLQSSEQPHSKDFAASSEAAGVQASSKLSSSLASSSSTSESSLELGLADSFVPVQTGRAEISSLKNSAKVGEAVRPLGQLANDQSFPSDIASDAIEQVYDYQKNWSLLRSRLKSHARLAEGKTRLNSFINQLAEDKAFWLDSKQVYALFLRILEGPRQARAEQRFLAFLFEDMDPKALHKLFEDLDLRDLSVGFFVEYMQILHQESQLRRMLNIIHATIDPKLPMNWYEESYRFLHMIWPELGLKAWHWLESEGALAFYLRLSEREDLYPATLLA